jgi:ubiquinone/menaquinone biosynthesis C-methylase UbiE
MSGKRRAVVVVITLLVAAAAILAYRVRRMRNEPSTLPYSQWLFTEFPRPFMTRSRLQKMLEPVAGQWVLEVGPGTGYYALHAARWISPGGTLEILDIEQRMLDDTMRRAGEMGIENIIPVQGNARELPYPDSFFDAAYLVATLGEVPERERVLEELRRVLKPGGRLVVGEGQPDPHMVGAHSLRKLAEAQELAFEHKIGNALGYFASFNAT